MPADPVVLERDGDIAILRLDRPPANALNLELTEIMLATCDRLEAMDPGAVVLAGVAPFFSGGLDLKAVPHYTPEQQRALILNVNRVMLKLYSYPRPLIGAITGHAMAGGFCLALLPDYRIGPKGDAHYGLTEVKVGIPFPAGPKIIVEAELAPADVRWIALTGRHFGPEEALARGVLDELQPPEKVLERALEVAREFADAPADGYASIKHQFRADAIAKLESLVANEDDPMLTGWLSADAASASAAVLGG